MMPSIPSSPERPRAFPASVRLPPYPICPADAIVKQAGAAAWQHFAAFLLRESEVIGELRHEIPIAVLVAVGMRLKQRSHEGLEIGDWHGVEFGLSEL